MKILITLGLHTGCVGGICITGIFENFYTKRGEFLTFKTGIPGGLLLPVYSISRIQNRGFSGLLPSSPWWRRRWNSGLLNNRLLLSVTKFKKKNTKMVAIRIRCVLWSQECNETVFCPGPRWRSLRRSPHNFSQFLPLDDFVVSMLALSASLLGSNTHSCMATPPASPPCKNSGSATWTKWVFRAQSL